MTQLIIEYSQYGEWSRKYRGLLPKKYKVISIPKNLLGEDKIIGVTVDNRDKWRKKLDLITQNASYDIILR
jgi:hypothetical protein